MKKLLSILTTVLLVSTMLLPANVSATSQTQTPVNCGWARIRYAGNNRYLDIPSEKFYENGAQLQVWDYVYGNQNQIFYFYDTGDGWNISSHLTDKVIEVRNSSHEDYAHVAQWEKHDLACARWDIIANEDGTVSFKNKESGLYLNVCGGGDAKNGTKIIQYHNDGTVVMKFYLEVMGYNDVLSATFERYTKVSEVKWTKYNPMSNVLNKTQWTYNNNGNYYYPSVGQKKIFDTAEYLSPNTVANLLRDKAYNQSTWNEIKDALNGELSNDAVAALLDKLGFESVPGLGYALGILQVLWSSREEKEWNRFVDAVQIDEQGRCSGVIVYTYYNIVKNPVWGPMNNGTTAWGTTYYIRKVPCVEYKQWTGDNFYQTKDLPVEVIDGRWWFYFK